MVAAKINAGLYTSDRDDWNSPSCVLDKVRELGPLVLDPCSNERSIVNAEVEFRLSRGEDGLRAAWATLGVAGGLVYLNPPYGDAIADWTRKATFEARRGAEIVALLPARTDTAWFQRDIATANALCFWRGRLRFGAAVADQRQVALFDEARAQLEEPDETAPFPSVIAYWGPRSERFVEVFSGCGITVRLHEVPR